MIHNDAHMDMHWNGCSKMLMGERYIGAHCTAVAAFSAKFEIIQK